MAQVRLPKTTPKNNVRVPRVRLECEQCSVVHFKYPSQIGGGKGRFCSQLCLFAYRRHGSTRACDRCGKKFYRRASEQGSSIKQFCSKICYSVHRRDTAKPTTYLKTDGVHSHIVVTEKALGRSLHKGEVVHHIDNNKHNNSVANLAVLPSQAFHAQVHFGKAPCDQYYLTSLIQGRTNEK